MGFLLGMAGKLAAGSRVRSLQAKMMRVQSQLRRVTREYSNMEKYINSWKNSQLNSIRYASAGTQQIMQAALQGRQAALQQQYFSGFDMSNVQNWTKEQSAAYQTAQSQYSTECSTLNNGFSSINQMMQMMMQQQQSSIEQQVEMMKETMLDPLKDTEDELQLEKDSLESQVQLAQQDYEACKEMEKAGAKNLKPDYTGQG